MHEASKHPCSPRHLSQVLVQLLRTWRFFSHQGMMVSLLALCGLLGAAVHLRLALASNSTLLWTHWETYVSMPTRGASVTAPVRDPRLLSPFPPRSALTAAFFCGRPTASSYDGYAGAAHAAYIHHDMDHDRFVVRTFGRGGTRVDLRRRTGIGRSTYEVFCGASVHAQTRTPLAPSPWVEGEANWQLSTAESHARPTNGGFNYTLEELAKPLSARGTSDHFDADFTKADQGLRTHYRRYSRDEVLAKNRHMDFIYSYVNGSDVTRLFLKPFATSGQCSSATTSVQLLWGALLRLKSAELADLGTSEKEFSRSVTAVLFADMSSPCSLADLHSSTVTSSEAVKRVQQSLEAALRAGTANPAAYASGTSHSTLTVSEMMTALGVTEALNKQDFLDWDSDELRHSMRGLLQHTRDWHRGRLSVVTPYANVPQWLNQSKGFFLRSLLADLHAQGGAGDDGPLGTADVAYVREAHTAQLHYTRVHVVDQRALMPPAPLTTVNSFVIEPFIYRLRNISAVFTFLNDDYLIMRDVDVAEFVNAYGGPVLRLDRPSLLQNGPWLDAFRRTLLRNLHFLQRALDELPADVDELLQPSLFHHHQLAARPSASTRVEHGVVQAYGAAFTAVVDTARTQSRLANSPYRRRYNDSGAAAGEWPLCAPNKTRYAAVCEFLQVSLEGEPSWTVDAAGRFELVQLPGQTRAWAGHAQTPRTTSWGSRVLGRAIASLVAPRDLPMLDRPAGSNSLHSIAAVEETRRLLVARISAVAKALRYRRGTTANRTAEVDALASVLHDWWSAVATIEYPDHRLMQTQPRLRKYRLRLDSHAPYVQCRNMWKYIHTRYAPSLSLNMLLLRQRTPLDFLPPSTHTAHLLRHPWAGSSQYIPYLMAKEAWRLQAAGEEAPRSANEPPVFPVVDVALDNEDGCAPATYITEELNAAIYEEFDDDVKHNTERMTRIRQYSTTTPFTNINSKFTKPEVGVVLRNFLEELFPTPMLLENGWQNGTDEPRVLLDVDGGNRTVSDPAYTLHHLRTAFHRLMRLPLILVSNDEEGFCPLLRSLRHAMPAFRGLRVVQVLVPPADGRSLYAARAAQRHAYRNFLPVTRCTLPPGRLTRVTLPAHSSTADAIVAGLRSAREGLEAEDWAAPALVALRGRRVARRAVQAVVLDARTLHGGAAGFTELPHALATPAELLAHEDFAEVLLDGDAYGAAQPYVRAPTDAEAAAPATATRADEKVRTAKPGDYASSVLVLSEADAQGRNVHWAYGASEHDLLSGMPLPHRGVEDLSAEVAWLF